MMKQWLDGTLYWRFIITLYRGIYDGKNVNVSKDIIVNEDTLEDR
jgi:hypothetical protein